MFDKFQKLESQVWFEVLLTGFVFNLLGPIYRPDK